MADKTLRELILNSDDLPSQVVTVKEWGDVKIEVRGMTAGDAMTFWDAVSLKDSAGESRIDRELYVTHLVLNQSYDPATGERVFENADRDALRRKSFKSLQQISRVAGELSGLAAEDDSDESEDFD